MIYPLTLDLRILQGATFYRQFTWKTGPKDARVPVDLTGAEIRMQARYSPHADEILLEASTTDGKIAIEDAAGGVFGITLPATETDGFTFRQAVYDLEVELSGTVSRLLEGKVRVDLQVTR